MAANIIFLKDKLERTSADPLLSEALRVMGTAAVQRMLELESTLAKIVNLNRLATEERACVRFVQVPATTPEAQMAATQGTAGQADAVQVAAGKRLQFKGLQFRLNQLPWKLLLERWGQTQRQTALQAVDKLHLHRVRLRACQRRAIKLGRPMLMTPPTPYLPIQAPMERKERDGIYAWTAEQRSNKVRGIAPDEDDMDDDGQDDGQW